MNWLDEGKISEVRWQGYNCNASWSIAAVTVLEAMVAIRDSAAPVRLSEQEAMDCTPPTNNYKPNDCTGGWGVQYWDWTAIHGA